MWELEKAGGKFDNFNSKQQKAIHELIDGLTEIPTKPNKDQYRVDNQSQYTKIVGRTYYNVCINCMSSYWSGHIH